MRLEDLSEDDVPAERSENESLAKAVRNVPGKGYQHLSGCLLCIPEIIVREGVTVLGLLTYLGVMELWKAMQEKQRQQWRVMKPRKITPINSHSPLLNSTDLIFRSGTC